MSDSLNNVAFANGGIRKGICCVGCSTGLVVDTSDVEALIASEESYKCISKYADSAIVVENTPFPLTVTFGRVARGARAVAKVVVAPMATAREAAVFMMDRCYAVSLDLMLFAVWWEDRQRRQKNTGFWP